MIDKSQAMTCYRCGVVYNVWNEDDEFCTCPACNSCQICGCCPCLNEDCEFCKQYWQEKWSELWKK